MAKTAVGFRKAGFAGAGTDALSRDDRTQRQEIRTRFPRLKNERIGEANVRNVGWKTEGIRKTYGNDDIGVLFFREVKCRDSHLTTALAAGDNSVNRVVFFTGHYFNSRRRAGFHWLANAFLDLGWEVCFVTTHISVVSRLRRDRRFHYPILQEANRLLRKGERLWSYVWYTPWHPVDLRSAFLNRLAHPLFDRYAHLPLGEVEAFIKSADLLLFESEPGLLLFDRCKSLAPQARRVYRCSDDLELLRVHPIVRQAERRVCPQFHLVSAPSYFIYQKLKELCNPELHFHGVEKELFDMSHSTPYAEKGPHFVFVGCSHLDCDFLVRASRLFPDCKFHIIGAFPHCPQKANIFSYGELPFHDTISYLKHADVGLQALLYSPGAESFTDSLKVLQYTYCRLPVVAPDFLRSFRSHVFNYASESDSSIRQCIEAALHFDREDVDATDIHTWAQLAHKLAACEDVYDPLRVA